MKLPVRLTSIFALALGVLLFTTDLHAAEARTDEVAAGSTELDLFPADPLADGVRISPTTALRGAGATDWAQLTDDTWCPSPWTISEMLVLYDTFSLRIDRSFVCFQGLDEAAFRWVLNEFPVCHGAIATIEGPLDRELAPVTIEGPSDPNGDPLTIVATAITQDEPVTEKGRHATCPDAAISAGVAQVRRERSVRGNGRVYVISFTASDGLGGECQGTATLCVPRIRGINGAGCVDDGQDYDSLAACGQ